MCSLRELPNVLDIRNLGLVGAIELEPVPGKPGVRAFDTFQRCFDKGVLIRTTGDISVLDDRRGRWVLEDNEGTQLVTDRMLTPRFCLRDGVRFDANSPSLPLAMAA